MRARISSKDQKYARMMVRLPERLHQHLAERAASADRSLNYEIITRLRASIELDKVLESADGDEVASAIARLRRRLVDLRLPDGEED